MTFHKIDAALHNRQQTWVHDSGTLWIVSYEATHDRRAVFRAYRTVERLPKGRHPWTVDNRRIGTDMGFLSLDEAMRAVEEFTTN